MFNPSSEALKNIAKEMKKKGIEKIAMVGKTDPKTVDKLEKLSEPSEDPTEDKKDSEETIEAMDHSDDLLADNDSGDQSLEKKLELIKKLLGKA
jgi:hypothetical protein